MRLLRVLIGGRQHSVALRVIVTVIVTVLGITAAPRVGHAACPSPPYLTLRYEEDYGFLRDPSCRTDFWDPLKYVPLDENGAVYLSTGVDARVKYEYFHNFLWGQGVQDANGYALQRYLVHGDLHVTRYLRGFAQFQSALEEGRQGGRAPPTRTSSR